jgi:hypothetical protein
MRQNEKELTLHIDWDQARDILIGWEQLVVTPHWLVEALLRAYWLGRACDVLFHWLGSGRKQSLLEE